MEKGKTLLFDISNDHGYTSAKGTIIDQCGPESFTVVVEDVYVGDSSIIGRQIEVYQDEITLVGEAKHLIKHKPRKLNYHANELN